MQDFLRAWPICWSFLQSSMNENINQTQFFEEGPLLQPESSLIPPEVAPIPETPWYKKPVVVIVGLLVLLMALLLAAALILRPREMMSDILQTEPSPSPVTQSDPLQAKVKALQKELLDADPAKQELPFPAVNLELKIPDDKSNR